MRHQVCSALSLVLININPVLNFYFVHNLFTWKLNFVKYFTYMSIRQRLWQDFPQQGIWGRYHKQLPSKLITLQRWNLQSSGSVAKSSLFRTSQFACLYIYCFEWLSIFSLHKCYSSDFSKTLLTSRSCYSTNRPVIYVICSCVSMHKGCINPSINNKHNSTHQSNQKFKLLILWDVKTLQFPPVNLGYRHHGNWLIDPVIVNKCM